MAEDKNKSKSKVFAYEVKYKNKRKKSFLPVEQFFEKLKELGNKNYDRKCGIDSRLRKIGDTLISYDVSNSVEDLEDFRLNYVDFFTGKEIKENIPTRNDKGEEDSYSLPEGLNFCFKTHGRFIFKKINDEWKCILFFEKKHAGISLTTFEYYLKSMFNDKTIIFNQINREEEIIERLGCIDKLYTFYMKKAPVDLGEYKDAGIDEQIEAKQSSDPIVAATLEFKNDMIPGNTVIDKIKSMFAWAYKDKKFNAKNLKNFVLTYGARVYGKRVDEPYPRTINLLSDIYLFEMEMNLSSERLVKEIEFFRQLNSKTQGIVEELFNLILE